MQRAAHYAGQRVDVQVFRVLISPLCVPFTSAPDSARGAGGLCVSIFSPTYILHFNPLPQGSQGVRDEMSCLQGEKHRAFAESRLQGIEVGC